MNRDAAGWPSLQSSDTVRRYVRGELAADQISRFEQALLQSVELQDQVEAELLLRDHAVAVDTSHPLRAHRNLHWMALAASVLVSFGSGYLVRSGVARNDTVVPVGVLTQLSFTSPRGAGAARFEAPAGRPLAGRFLVASDLPHRLQVHGRDGVLRVSLDGLQPADDGYLLVLLPAFAAVDGPLVLTLTSSLRQDVFELQVRS